MIDTIHIAVCMKPIDGNFAQNAIEHGVAGLNVDGSRIATGDENLGDASRFDGSYNHVRDEWHRPHMTDETMSKKKKECFVKLKSVGRFPANVILDGSDEVESEFPETKSGKLTTKSKAVGWDGDGGKREWKGASGDSGSASRFFKECPSDD